MNRGSERAFTLVEVLVAIVLIGIAVSSAAGALGSLTTAFRMGVERERLHRLAQQKFDDIVATGEWATVSEGQFEGERYENFNWSTETEATGIEGLEYLRLTVTQTGPGKEQTASCESLVYRPPTTTVPLGGEQ